MEALTISHASLDPIQDAVERQAAILTRIDALERAANFVETDPIRHLREEYNDTVLLSTRLEMGPLPDPLVVLPPELWPSIFQEVIKPLDFDQMDTLLDLTTVSQSWFWALTSIPMLWTKVRLNHSSEDSLAKAMIFIHLSGVRNIALQVNLPLGSWRKVSYVFAPIGNRIESLSLEHVRHPAEIEVLADFVELPALRKLRLPSSRSAKYNSNYYHELGIERMPRLETIRGHAFLLSMSHWDRFTRHFSFGSQATTTEQIRRTETMPNLTRLCIKEPVPHREEGFLSVPDGFLRTVVSFTYTGTCFHDKLRLLGDKLTELDFGGTGNGVSDGDPFTLLAPLWRFPRLRSLKLVLAQYELAESLTPPSIILHSVKLLWLQFLGDIVGWGFFLDALITTLPCVETLKISNGENMNSCFAYIESLESLHDLSMVGCTIDPSVGSVTPRFLTDLEWLSGDIETFLNKFNAPSLRCLRIGFDRVAKRVDGNRIQLPKTSFPCMKRLSIVSKISMPGGLDHHKLRKLVLRPTHDPSAAPAWISDILVAILLRPRDTPALEELSLKGDFLEWDILILLLERKNFLAESNVSLIKFVVPSVQLPYKLLYPISELLRGRFVERGPIAHFSTEGIGQRLWDQSLTGCNACMYAFRECCEPVITFVGSMRCGASVDLPVPEPDVLLPSEFLMADPPLKPEVAQWLLKQRERRTIFERGDREARNRLLRTARCLMAKAFKVTVTGFSLSGARFGHEV